MELTLPFGLLHICAYTAFVIAATLTCYWFLGKKDASDSSKWAIAWTLWGLMFVFCVLVVANYVISADAVKKDIYNKFELVPKAIAQKACPSLYYGKSLNFSLNATLDADKPF